MKRLKEEFLLRIQNMFIKRSWIGPIPDLSKIPSFENSLGFWWNQLIKNCKKKHP